jgi:hypothetical protein
MKVVWTMEAGWTINVEGLVWRKWDARRVVLKRFEQALCLYGVQGENRSRVAEPLRLLSHERDLPTDGRSRLARSVRGRCRIESLLPHFLVFFVVHVVFLILPPRLGISRLRVFAFLSHMSRIGFEMPTHVSVAFNSSPKRPALPGQLRAVIAARGAYTPFPERGAGAIAGVAGLDER